MSSKLLKMALSRCFSPPHVWVEKEEGWVRCTKCELVTTEELLATHSEAFRE